MANLTVPGSAPMPMRLMAIRASQGFTMPLMTAVTRLLRVLAGRVGKQLENLEMTVLTG